MVMKYIALGACHPACGSYGPSKGSSGRDRIWPSGADRSCGKTVRFSEEHVMRYLFPTEVEFLAQKHGMQVKAIEEFLTGRAPSSSSWGVAYLLQL
jgi:hypothetical protein